MAGSSDTIAQSWDETGNEARLPATSAVTASGTNDVAEDAVRSEWWMNSE